jgi:hypothetical protein
MFHHQILSWNYSKYVFNTILIIHIVLLGKQFYQCERLMGLFDIPLYQGYKLNIHFGLLVVKFEFLLLH